MTSADTQVLSAASPLIADGALRMEPLQLLAAALDDAAPYEAARRWLQGKVDLFASAAGLGAGDPGLERLREAAPAPASILERPRRAYVVPALQSVRRPVELGKMRKWRAMLE